MIRLLERRSMERTTEPPVHFYRFWRDELEKMGAMQILQWAIENFPKLVLETDFSMSNVVMLSMLSQLRCELRVVSRFAKNRNDDLYEAVLVDASIDPETGKKDRVLRWDIRRKLFVIAPLAHWNDEMIRCKIMRDSFPEFHRDAQKKDAICCEWDFQEW